MSKKNRALPHDVRLNTKVSSSTVICCDKADAPSCTTLPAAELCRSSTTDFLRRALEPRKTVGFKKDVHVQSFSIQAPTVRFSILRFNHAPSYVQILIRGKNSKHYGLPFMRSVYFPYLLISVSIFFAFVAASSPHCHPPPPQQVLSCPPTLLSSCGHQFSFEEQPQQLLLAGNGSTILTQ